MKQDDPDIKKSYLILEAELAEGREPATADLNALLSNVDGKLTTRFLGEVKKQQEAGCIELMKKVHNIRLERLNPERPPHARMIGVDVDNRPAVYRWDGDPWLRAEILKKDGTWVPAEMRLNTKCTSFIHIRRLS